MNIIIKLLLCRYIRGASDPPLSSLKIKLLADSLITIVLKCLCRKVVVERAGVRSNLWQGKLIVLKLVCLHHAYTIEKHVLLIVKFAKIIITKFDYHLETIEAGRWWDNHPKAGFLNKRLKTLMLALR